MQINKKTTIILTSLVLLDIAGVLILWWLWSFANRPLSASLINLSALSTTQAGSNVNLQEPAANSTGYPSPLFAPTEYTTPLPMSLFPTPTMPSGTKTLCGGPSLMFIQVAGVDHYNLADAIRIVRVDFVKPQVSVLAIQRATWVSIPHLEEHGITAFLLNSAHSYGNYWMGPEGGAKLLAETIALNFGLQSDHYLDVKFDGFVTVVDAVGGVDVNLPDGAYDPKGTKLSLDPGMHHLDGKTALMLVRMRYSDTDWKRIDRQSDLATDLFKQLTAPAMLPMLPGLVNQLKGDFLTNLSPVEIGQLLCLATKISGDEIKFYVIGQDMVIPTTLNDKTKSQIMVPKYDLILPYVEKFINGTLP